MAQTIKIKRSTATAVPSTLAQGELAYSTLNGGKLFIGRPGGTTGDIDVIGGKYYVDKVDSIQISGTGVNTDTDGTITGGLAYNLTTGSITSTLEHADRFIGTPGQFGSATAIPVITVDKEGHVTSLTTASVATALTIEDDQSDTDTIDLLTDTLKLLGGTYITSNITAADTITFSHDATTRVDTTSTATPAPLGTFTAVDSVITNTEGHVTAVNVKTITMPADTKYDYAAVDTAGVISLNLTGSDSTTDKVDVVGDTHIGISSTGATNLTVSHKDVARSNTTGTPTSTTFGGTFSVITGVSSDAKGHITGAETTTFTLPVEADTLDTVTTRGNTTANDIYVGDLYVGYPNHNVAGATSTIYGSGSLVLDPTGHGDATGTVIVEGNLTVKGTTTTVNSNQVDIGDSILLLNSDETSAPSQDAGFEVERGTYINVQLRWNETTDQWQVTLPNVGQDAVTVENLLTHANFETLIPTLDGGTF